MPDSIVEALRQAIRDLHGFDSTYRETQKVREVFHGKTVWEGEVFTFDLAGHPTARLGYGWATKGSGSISVRFVAVLGEGKIDSPEAAVRAWIVSENRPR
jgi:hypothetical protein